MKGRVSSVLGGDLVVSAEDPELGRVFKGVLSIAQLVQEAA